MIELMLLNSVIATRSVAPLVRSGLMDEKVWHEQRPAFNYIRQHVADHGEVPSVESVMAACPPGNGYEGFELVEVRESADTLIAKHRERNLKLAARKLLEQTAGKYNELDGYKLFEAMSDGIERIRKQLEQTATTGVTNWSTDQTQREATYDQRKQRDLSRVVPLLFPALTAACGGLPFGSYTNLCAFTGVGKSWLAALQALVSNEAGFKVLIESGEMYEDEYESRLDTLAGGFNNYGLWTGSLEGPAEQLYREYLKKQAARNRPDLIIRTPEHWPNGLTIEQLRHDIRRFKPDVVIIDQFNLCRTGHTAQEKADFSRQLKLLFAAEGVVGIVLTQANGEFGKRQNDKKDDDDAAIRELRPPRKTDYSETIAVSQDAGYFVGLDAVMWPDPVTGKKRGKGLALLDKSRSGGDGTQEELHWMPGDGIIAPREATDIF